MDVLNQVLETSSMCERTVKKEERSGIATTVDPDGRPALITLVLTVNQRHNTTRAAHLF